MTKLKKHHIQKHRSLGRECSPEHTLPRDLCFATHMKIAVLLNKTNEKLKKNQQINIKTPIWEAKAQKQQKTLGKTNKH